MNFILRDKENYNFPSLNATIQFVEIACHERLSSTLKDTKKFQDSLAFNAQLAALQKVMLGIHNNKKILPYKDSKLTKIMQNYCNVNSEVTVLCHAISNPQEFIACLSYLQLVSRFRSDKKEKDLVAEVQRVAGDLKGEQVASNLTPAEEKELRYGLDTIRELDTKLEFMKKEYSSNMAKIGSIIGAKENLEHLIRGKASPFWYEFKEKGALLQRIALKDQVLLEKDLLVIKTQKKIEDLKRELTERLEAHIVNTYQLQDEINYVRDKSNIVRNNMSDNNRELVSQKYDKLRQLAANNRALLAEKTQTTSKFPNRLMELEEPAKTQTMESIKQQALQVQRIKNEEILQKMKEQNDRLIESKCKEVGPIYSSTKIFCRQETATATHSWQNATKRSCERSRSMLDTRKVEKELETEIVNLYQFLKKQSKIVYNIKVSLF